MVLGDINFIGSTSLGKINRWESKKAATVTPISFPGQNEGKTEGVDTLGIIRYLTFRGRITGDYTDIQDALYAINSIMDGAQISASTLHSPFVNVEDGNGVRRQGSQGVTTSTTAFELEDTDASFYIEGIQIGDHVKNLSTGHVTTVATVPVSGIHLTLNDNIFTNTGEAYAVAAQVSVKLLGFDTTWELPGLSWVDYKMTCMVVR